MNSSERVLRAIAHKETDRVPFDIFGTSRPMMDRIKKGLGIARYEEAYEFLGVDIWDIADMAYIGPKRYYKGDELDCWGCSAKARLEGDSSSLCPLSDVNSMAEVEVYPWPDAADFYAGDIQNDIASHPGFAIRGGVWAPIFHHVTWLCGFENTLAYLHTQPDIMRLIIKKITDFWLEYTRKILENGKDKIHIIQNCNDFGSQESTIISPAMFRDFFKPELKRLYDVIKNYDVKVMQHSCGSISELIPDFIEIGADILNPVQSTAKNMNIADLRAKHGDKITFDGGIDTQHILPEASSDDVRREVRCVLDIMSGEGGYILCGSQGLESDIPLENIAAMYDEGKSYGSKSVRY